MMTEFHVSEAGHYPTNVPNHSREREKRKETGLAVPLQVAFFHYPVRLFIRHDHGVSLIILWEKLLC